MPRLHQAPEFCQKTYMKTLIASAALLLLSAAAQAAEPMSAAEFERYVTGKTLYYGLSGEAYGVE